jgi:hypothetical protein
VLYFGALYFVWILLLRLATMATHLTRKLFVQNGSQPPAPRFPQLLPCKATPPQSAAIRLPHIWPVERRYWVLGPVRKAQLLL